MNSSPTPTVNIGKVNGPVMTAGTMYFGHRPDRTQQSMAPTAAAGPARGGDPETSFSSFMADGPMSSSPPHHDTTSADHEADFPVPTQISSPSPEGDSLPAGTQQTDEQPAAQSGPTPTRAPVTVEASADYMTAGREYDGAHLNGAGLNGAGLDNIGLGEMDLNNIGLGEMDLNNVGLGDMDLNRASAEDPTAMSELKSSQLDCNAAEFNPQTGEAPVSVTEPPGRFSLDNSGRFSVDNTDLNPPARPDQGTDHLHENIGAMNNSPDEMTELKRVAQSEGAYSDLTADGPEQVSLSSPSSMTDLRSFPRTLHGSLGRLALSQSDSALAHSQPRSEDGQVFRDCTVPCESLLHENSNSMPAAVVPSDSGGTEYRHSERTTGCSERQEGEMRPSQSSLDSTLSTLQADCGEGGGGEPSLAEDVFVFSHGRLLIQDDDSSAYVSVVEVSPCTSVVESGEKEGAIPGGSSRLVQMKWSGHRTFFLSQWRVTLKPETHPPSQTQSFIKHVCRILQDREIKRLRGVTRQLKLQHSVFLHGLTWDGGLVVHLGHINPSQREERMASPCREAVWGTLQQLFSGCDLELAWQDPQPFQDRETEGGSAATPGAETNLTSVSSTDLFDSGQATPSGSSEDAQDSPSQQPAPSESAFSDHSISSVSDRTSGSVMQLLGEIMQKFGRLAEECESRLGGEDQQQLRQQIMNIVESGKEEMEHSVKEIRFQLEKCHTSTLSLNQKQEEAGKHQEEMVQLMNQMRKQQEEQSNTIAEMDRDSERRQRERDSVQGEMKQEMKRMGENLEGMEKRTLRVLQEQTKAVEDSTDQKHKHLTEELIKHQEQLKEMQQEMLHQKQRQEELYTILKNGQIFQSLRSTQHGEESYIVGMVHEEREEAMGAVGGVMTGVRNSFSSALAESETTTSKMKGKDEEIGSNQLEKIHPMTADSLGQEPELQRLLLPSEPEQAGERGPPANDSASGVVAAQGGARSKTTGVNPVNMDTTAEDSNSPKSGRRMDRGGEDSQQRTTGSTSSEAPDDNYAKAERFLNWVQFKDSSRDTNLMKKNILRHVSAALQEEVEAAPRAQCLDTILCIDVSESIVSEGLLDTVKNTAMKFVDGIEDLMNEMDMEENIGVVALGGNARVVQHLTNDLTLVREAIESLDSSGGRSPFMQALLVCLAAIKGRGGVLNVAGVYKVRPRIIFITDGCPTDEAQEMGPDLSGNNTQTRFALLSLIHQLASRRRKSTPSPITWVSVGQKADQKLLKSLAELTSGQLVMPEEIQSLCRYYKMQQLIGRLLKMVKNYKEDSMSDDKIREMLQAMCSYKITEEEKGHIVEAVKELQNLPDEEQQPEADDYNTVFEDKGKVKSGKLLPLGTRVVRGPDWKWQNQDTDGPGTVIQHSKNNSWLYVKWDNGTYNAYRCGEEGKADIVETQHHPRQIPHDSDRLELGVRVIRGPDWDRENEDGQGPGTVIRCRESDGNVKVRWDITGKICEYNYSRTKGREIQMNLPEFPRHGLSEGLDSGFSIDLLDESEGFPMWRWRDDLGQRRLYDEFTNSKLESEYKKRPRASCIITRAGIDRRVSFRLMQEKAVDGGSLTVVTRDMVDEERKNDLLAMEMSLQEYA